MTSNVPMGALPVRTSHTDTSVPNEMAASSCQMAASSCQICSFRADEHGQHCARCLGGKYLFENGIELYTRLVPCGEWGTVGHRCPVVELSRGRSVSVGCRAEEGALDGE